MTTLYYYEDSSDESYSDTESYGLAEISEDMSKFTIFKQDPFTLNGQTTDIILPNIQNGPRNNNLYNATSGIHVKKDKNNNFTPRFGTKEFGVTHAFAYGESVMNMIDRDMEFLSSWGQNDLFSEAFDKWKNKGKLAIKIDQKINDPSATYRRQQGGGRVVFNSFYSKEYKQEVSSYLSFDIVIHEVAHYILDVLRPDFANVDRPQTKALHESWADLLVVFMKLDQSILRSDLLSLTKGDLSKKSFLPTIAEEFGVTLEHNRNGLRNAAERITMENVEREIHSFSQVFTGAIYDLLAIAFKEKYLNNRILKMEEVLEQVAKDIRHLVLLTFIRANFDNPSFFDMRKIMKTIALEFNRFNYLAEYISKVFGDRGIKYVKGHKKMDKYDRQIEATHPVTHGAEFSLCKTCHHGYKC